MFWIGFLKYEVCWMLFVVLVVGIDFFICVNLESFECIVVELIIFGEGFDVIVNNVIGFYVGMVIFDEIGDYLLYFGDVFCGFWYLLGEFVDDFQF